MMKQLRVYGIAIVLLSLIGFVYLSTGFAETLKAEAMERKCKAANAGKEIDDQVKKVCALYFEQTGANAANGVAEEAARSASSQTPYQSTAYIALGLGIIGAVMAPFF